MPLVIKLPQSQNKLLQFISLQQLNLRLEQQPNLLLVLQLTLVLLGIHGMEMLVFKLDQLLVNKVTATTDLLVLWLLHCNVLTVIGMDRPVFQ